MDPDEALRVIREIIGRYGVEPRSSIGRDDAVRLFEHIDALDEWLSRGGFLPAAWSCAAPAWRGAALTVDDR